MSKRPRRGDAAPAGVEEGWPKALGAAEREFERTVERLLAGLDSNARQAFVWRASGRLATFETDSQPPPALAPRADAAEEMVESIRQWLRKRLGPRAVAPGEVFHYPDHVPDFAGYTACSVEHTDAFLYDDDELDELVDEGKLSRYYCGSIGPRDIRELNFVSHSFSIAQLRFLFSESALGALGGKTVVDVGSRLGAVLWAGSAYSEAKRLVGIELSGFFAQLQQDAIDHFQLGARCESVHADVLACAKLLRGADIVILNNVFQFFHSKEAQAQIWRKLRPLLAKKGLRLVTVPALATSLEQAGATDINLCGWVRELPLRQPYPTQPSIDAATVQESAYHSEALAEQNETFAQIHLYEVLT